MPFAAVLPAIIAAGASVGGGIISSKMSASAQKKAQEAAQNSPDAVAQRNLISQQAGYGKQAGDLAGALFPTYTDGVKYLGDYFKNFLGEDSDAAMRAAAPLLRLRKNQTAGLLRAQDFAPRGGGRGESLFNLYSDEAGDTYDILANERANARAGFEGLVGDVGARASGLLGEASGAAGSGASLLGQRVNQQFSAGQTAAARSDANVRDIGSGLGSLLIDLMRAMGNKKSGGMRDGDYD